MTTASKTFEEALLKDKQALEYEYLTSWKDFYSRYRVSYETVRNQFWKKKDLAKKYNLEKSRKNTNPMYYEAPRQLNTFRWEYKQDDDYWKRKWFEIRQMSYLKSPVIH